MSIPLRQNSLRRNPPVRCRFHYVKIHYAEGVSTQSPGLSFGNPGKRKPHCSNSEGVASSSQLVTTVCLYPCPSNCRTVQSIRGPSRSLPTKSTDATPSELERCGSRFPGLPKLNPGLWVETLPALMGATNYCCVFYYISSDPTQNDHR
jgi:hypothetical protein